MTLDKLKNEVEFYTGLDITKRTRQRDYIYARCIFYKLAKELTLHTFHDISKIVNIRQHGTVMNGLRRFEEIKMYEPNFYNVYCKIKNMNQRTCDIIIKDVFLTDQNAIKLE